jgi:hypothetical protein
MRRNFWNKRIPSLIGVFFLVVALGSITWMSKNVIDVRGKAAPSETPRNIQVTNVTDTSFTVSYVTDASVLGTLAYAKDPSGGKVGLDDQDQQTGAPSPHQIHHLTVQKLDPGTKYYFTIVSGTTSILDNGQPFTVTTGSTITVPPSNQAPLVGKVTLPDGSIPAAGLVYVSSDNSQMLSVLLQQDGGYVLPLNSLRTKDFSSYATISNSTVLHLQIENATMNSSVSVLASQTNPVPLITLSQNYDFSVSTNPLPGSPSSASPSAALTPLPSVAGGFGAIQTNSSSSSAATGPSIQTPQDAEKFSDQQPLFKGTATPNESVQITIQSADEISTSVQADATGSWQFRPNVKLAPGQHTITIITKDINGVVQTISRQFTVFASGSQFTEPSLTPKAAPTASPSAAPIIPTPTFAAAPTSSPTATLIPTATPTIVLPTVTPASGSGIIATQPPLPKTGTSALVLSATAILLSIGAGLLIFLGGIPI